jgi:hypothetical protein
MTVTDDLTAVTVARVANEVIAAGRIAISTEILSLAA